MRAALRVFVCSIGLALALGGPAAGQGVTAVGPFTGSHSDNFDSLGLPFGSAHTQLTIFGGFGLVKKLTTGSIKYEFDSNLGGDQVNNRSPQAMIGQLCIAEWSFATPITRFGGYWENNSRFDHAQVEFFDATGALFDTETANVPKAAQEWTWNGWESATPLSRIVVTGNDVGFLNGFIWYDDMEVTAAVPVPEPAACLLAAGAGCLLAELLRRRGHPRAAFRASVGGEADVSL